MFYADTAMFGAAHALRCTIDFYGAERVLFASETSAPRSSKATRIACLTCEGDLMARHCAAGSRKAVALGMVVQLAVAAQTGSSVAAPVAIKVGDVEGAPASFIALGVQNGIFAEHRLIVQQGGAAIIPNVVSGQMQIGGSNIVSVLLGRSTGLPVKIIAPGTAVGSDLTTDFSAVIVAPDSPITTPTALAGKQIAVNTLKNVSEGVLKAALEASGVDIANIKLVELPFSSMLAAVERHQVDAVFVIEPFVTMARSQGARLLIRPYVRAALPTIAKLQPDLARTVNIPVWSQYTHMPMSVHL